MADKQFVKVDSMNAVRDIKNNAIISRDSAGYESAKKRVDFVKKVTRMEREISQLKDTINILVKKIEQMEKH